MVETAAPGAAYPLGVVGFLAQNPGAHAGDVAGWWFCRYPVDRDRTLSAGRCKPEDVLTALKELREEARLVVQDETGWKIASGADGTWKAAERFGTGRVAAAGLVRLRELIAGAAPTEAEEALAGAVPG
jgi:hypothetical protein